MSNRFTSVPDLPSLLVVDDDQTFAEVLARSLRRRGYAVTLAHNQQQALAEAEQSPPEYAVVDLKLGDDSGLKLIEALQQLEPATRIVMLTGYASIATAVEAIKLGAVHYLAKPTDADSIVAAFGKLDGDASVLAASEPLSVDRLEWEHIQKVLLENDGNVSATARALNMHRRTLQRKLGKRPSQGGREPTA